MATKKNLPNIPLYIGDWQKDCASLSMSAQGAWLQIIFKLWTNGKQNSCKIPTKSLQILWSCSESEMQDILSELIYNNISDISITEGFIEFTCRRFVKENKISEIRSEAAKKEKKLKPSKTKPKQNESKREAKREQNADIDIDIENAIENKDKEGGMGEEKENYKIEYPFGEEFLKQWEAWKEYKFNEYKFRYKNPKTEQAALVQLTKLARDETTAIAVIHQSIANGWKGLFELKNNGNEKNFNNRQQSGVSETYKRNLAERLAAMQGK